MLGHDYRFFYFCGGYYGTIVMARPISITKDKILAAELERVFRNTFNLTPQSLKETHPSLTKGDIRIYILSHLQFSVSDQATLLGISPSSVTKARQRLKAKL